MNPLSRFEHICVVETRLIASLRAFLPCLLLSLCLARGVGAKAAALVVKDINGASHNLLSSKAKATVLIFIAHDCPISNGYAPEINRLCATYTPKQVAFYVVYAEPDLALSQAKAHARDYGYKCAALMDTGLRLAKRTQVEVTPEVAVLSPQGKVLYRGRIDNRYVGYGKMRLQPTQRDLQAALDAVIKGKLIAHPLTKAIGCFIPTSP